MAETQRYPQPGLWRRCWRGLDAARRAVFNLLFLGLLVVLAVALVRDRTPTFASGSALVVAPVGMLSDQVASVDPLLFWLGETQPAEQSLAELIEAIDRAAADDRIPMLVLQLRDLRGGGLSKLQELAAALQRFRASDKPVVAVGDAYTQDQYYLASHADLVLLNPMGAVELHGYGVYQNYFRDALDKLAVDVNVFRIGQYKSAVEPFTRNDMSESARRANLSWLDDLWRQYLEAVAGQRRIAPETLSRYASDYAAVLAETDGDAAQAALRAGLVDQLLSRPAMTAYLQAQLGSALDDGFPAVDVAHYLAATEPDIDEALPAVGVITATGIILDGEQPLGTIGGDTLAALLLEARLDDDIRAVVLRIDTGGGSAYAAEVIRQELLALKRAGKPVVVSMGSVAASGGYWIAADADQIWATSATLTGSIGIFGALPTVDRTLQQLGIHTDGVGTTAIAGGFRPDRPLSDQYRAIMQMQLEQGYRRFITLVAGGRNMPAERVESVAQGRVWSGLAARDVGLVDQIGGLREAQRAAAELVGLEEWRLLPIEPALTPQERLLRQLMEATAGVLVPEANIATGLGVRLWRQYRQGGYTLAMLNDPRGFYLLCSACNAP